MTPVEIATLVGAIGSVLLSLANIGMQWKKWTSNEEPSGVVKMTGDLTNTGMQLLREVRDQAERDRKQAEQDKKQFTEKLEKLERENAKLRAKLEELEDVRDWAERLSRQVISLQGIPVKMRTRVE